LVIFGRTLQSPKGGVAVQAEAVATPIRVRVSLGKFFAGVRNPTKGH
jgi:hypothetical protein